MPDIEKLKRQTNAYRSHLVASINKLNTELAKEQEDDDEANVNNLKTFIKQIEIKYEKWEQSIMVLQEEDGDIDIDASMNDLNDMLDRVTELKVRAETLINLKATEEAVKVKEEEAAAPNESPKVKDKINLPKLNMKTFNGIDIEQFQEWYQMFEATIHRSRLSDVEKFIYLKMYLDKDALSLAEGYKVTKENYGIVLNELKETYGDKEVVINHHVSKLINLPKQTNPKEMKDLYHTIASNVRSLEALGVNSEQYSIFLVPIVKSKLNDDFRKEITKKKVKDIVELLQELKVEVDITCSSDQVKQAFEPEVPSHRDQRVQNKPNKAWSNPSYQYQSVSSAQALTANTNTRTKYCIFCPGTQSHWVEECKKAPHKSPEEVKEIVMKENACLGCMRKGHKIKFCRTRSQLKCAKCGSTSHHTLLHEDGRRGAYLTVTESNNNSTVAESNAEVSEDTKAVVVKGATALQARLGKESTLMPIMKVRVKGVNGKKLELNALVDQCSDQSFMRSDAIKALELDGPTIPIEVTGITGMTDGGNKRKRIQTSLFNKEFSQEVKVSCIEMPEICKPIRRPAISPDVLNSKNLRNLQLADNYADDEDREIHLLIGLDHYYNCITGKVKRAKDQPVAIETVFGWMLVSDSLNQDLDQSPHSTTLLSSMFIYEEIENGINNDLRKFWELDEEIITKPVKPENESAMKKFHESVKYDPETKKYEVGLPYINDKDISSNYKKTEIMLKSQMKRFEKNPILKEKYHQAMNEYIDSGFAELVPEDEIYSRDPDIYYMPHTGVFKDEDGQDENITTKTRAVFNASSAAKGKLSLNDKLLKGPKRQPSIPEILIRWRSKSVALVADIRKMYSMIEVRKEDRNALRFLWVKDGKILHYRHKVLPFGVRPAPYLAIETVHSHILKFGDEYPEVVESLIDSTFVDDYCTSEDTAEAAIDTVTASSNIMKEAGMELRKWKSNDPEVSKHLTALNQSTPGESNQRKVLGVWWNAADDEMYYVNPLTSKPAQHITKRMIVGSVPTLHDPMGFIAPIIVKGKMMIQKLWAAGVEWDENLVGTNIANEWLEWREDLQNLKNIKLDRKYVPAGVQVKNKQVHIFTDASEKAYAAVAYMRSEDENGKVHISMITAKTKVAPLKFVTLARLELLSAQIGSRLSLKIKAALNDPSIKFYHWSDSEIVLHWIKNTETRWKTFVENHVGEIRDNTDPESWCHCPGKKNPADPASRGTSIEQLQASSWWRGPDWLANQSEEWPKNTKINAPNKEVLKEKRSLQYTCLVADAADVPQEEESEDKPEDEESQDEEQPEYEISPHRYSEVCTLLKKTAYLRRFPNNCRLKKENKELNLEEITAEEINDAQNSWLRRVQQEYYPEEIRKLKAKQPVKKDSKIVQLSPYLDKKSGLIRMRGRIQNSNLTESEKHPIILPHQSHIVRLLIEDVHQKELHAGVNHTLVALRNEFWITNGRRAVKNVVKSCLKCRMYMPKRLTVPMAPLPEDRVNEASPFEIIGIDFTGPVIVEETKMVTKRKTKKVPVKVVKVKTTSKYYIALTTCAVTRAIHLELVPDMTTDAFIRSFRRFVSRRGTCSIIYSDNAKTYKCAEKGIKECYEVLNSPKFREFLTEKSITWKYICPLSPWWGGYWERLMKTIKIPLKKTLGRSFMNSDELYTVLTEVEAMVNSRPLCPVYDDPNDLTYLTPASFLIGRSTINLPVRPLKHTEVHPTATRKELNNMLMNQEKNLEKIWKMWREEFLRIQGVCPAIKEDIPLKEEELVMVASNKSPRCTWKVGRVLELVEGRDKRIRSVIVMVDGKPMRRPVQLISKLEISS